MNKKIIINILFNVDPGWKKNPHEFTRLTKEWIDYRIDIFMKYTCESLKKQTNQDFMCFIAYDKLSKDLIKSSLDKYESLPNNIVFTDNIFRDTILEIKKGCDYVYITRLDSDNMYNRHFVQKLYDVKINEDTKAILAQRGYAYNTTTKEIATYYDESPPFFALVYKSQDYLNGKYHRVEGGHPGIIKLNPILIDGYNFIVVVHELNTLNRFYNGFYEKLIEDENERNRLITELNIYTD